MAALNPEREKRSAFERPVGDPSKFTLPGLSIIPKLRTLIPEPCTPNPTPPNPNPKPKPKQIRLNQISKLNQSKTLDRIEVKHQTETKQISKLNQSKTPHTGLSNSIADEVLEALEVSTA